MGNCEAKRFMTNRRIWEAEKRKKTSKTNQWAVLALLHMQICSTAWGSLGKRSWDLFAVSVMSMKPLCPVARACGAKTLIASFLFDNLISLEVLTTDMPATLLSAFLPQGRIVMSLCCPYACLLTVSFYQ